MITLSNALAATADIAGFQLTVKPCSFWLNGTLTSIQPTTVFLSPNSSSFVYLNLVTSTVGVNTSGFPANSIPIATAGTDFKGVSTLIDKRPDFLAGGVGGSTTLTVSSNTVLTGVSGILYVLATGGSSGISITYPSPASASTDGTIVVKKVDAGVGAVTVIANLDGNGNYALTNQNQYVSGVSDGSNWWIVANN